MLGRFLKSLVAAAALLALARSAVPAPAMQIDEPVFDFGNVVQNTRAAHVFWLKSVGDDTLKILNVVPGCGCTKAPLEKTVLAPGDSTRLEVIFSTGNYRGQVAKTPKIQTNDSTAVKSVRILCNVLAPSDSTYPVVVTPNRVDISPFGEKPRTQTRFTLQNVSETDLNVKVIDWPKEVLRVDLPSKIGAGKTIQGRINLDGVSVDSEFEKSITLQLDDENHTRLTIPLCRTIRSTAGATQTH